MYFPVAGAHSFVDDFGALRPGGRTHHGVDVFADKGTPVLTVADGVVIKAAVAELAGNYLVVRHPDRWTSWYLHLNNDQAGTDDGQGTPWPPEIHVGAEIEGGALIGWVGDSGNAEGTPPHLHFELHTPEGQAVNPYIYLRAAAPLSVAEVAGLAAWSATGLQELLPDTGSPSRALVGLGSGLVALGWLLVGAAALTEPLGRHGGAAFVMDPRYRGRHRVRGGLADSWRRGV